MAPISMESLEITEAGSFQILQWMANTANKAEDYNNISIM